MFKPNYLDFLGKYLFTSYEIKKTLDGNTLFLLMSEDGRVDGVKFPEELIKKAGLKEAFLRSGEGGEPIASGLLLSSAKRLYLITPYSISVLAFPATRAVYSPTMQAVFSPNRCKLVSVSRRVFGFFPFTVASQPTIKILDYCQGE